MAITKQINVFYRRIAMLDWISKNLAWWIRCTVKTCKMLISSLWMALLSKLHRRKNGNTNSYLTSQCSGSVVQHWKISNIQYSSKSPVIIKASHSFSYRIPNQFKAPIVLQFFFHNYTLTYLSVFLVRNSRYWWLHCLQQTLIELHKNWLG